MLHLLYTSTFNIINLYSNQKDKIRKNINYLKYFYHLFPTHVDKFYSLFRRYVNPKIEELKESICKIPGTSDVTSMLSLTKAILGTTKGIITVLSGQLTNHIHSTMTNLNSLVETIYCGQLVRFEQVKKKVDQEVTSFEKKLEQTVKNISKEITLKMLEIIVSLESHRAYVREELKKYVKKIGSDLAYLKRYGFIGIHNDLYEFEHGLDQIERILSRPGYHGAYNLRKKFLRKMNGHLGDIGAFSNFMEQLYRFQGPKGAIKGMVGPIRCKIQGIRLKLEELQSKIPVMGENDYEDWKLMKKIESLKLVDGNVPLVTSLHTEILGIIPDFEKIKDRIKPLRESMEPIKRHLRDRILIDFENAADARAILERAADKLDRLVTDIRLARLLMENALRINGYLKLTDHNIIFKYNEPSFWGLERIEDFILAIENLCVALKGMEGWIGMGFRNLRKRYMKGLGPDEIFKEPKVFSSHISEKTKKLKEELKKYTETLNSIKSIHKELKAIEEIANEQDKAMNGTVSSNGLGSSSLEKIKGAIEGFVKIESNIDRIVRCYEGKQSELKHIKDNVERLKSLRPELLKLQFSIRSDIMFAKIIENIVKDFESLKTEAEKEFKKVELYIGYLITNIEYIIKSLSSICSIIETIRCKKSELRDLTNLKPNMDNLKSYLERLSECINVTNGYLGVLNYRVLILQKYMGKMIWIETRIMLLRFGLMTLPFIERFPDVLFSWLNVDYIIKCHEFFEKINNSIKSALDTIEHFRLFLRIIIFENKLAGFWVTWVIGEIKTKSDVVRNNITEVESSIESVIVCFLKFSNKYIINNTIESTKRLLTSVGNMCNNELVKSNFHELGSCLFYRHHCNYNGYCWLLQILCYLFHLLNNTFCYPL